MLEKVKELMVEALELDADEITLDSKFKEDLNIDSLDLFEMVMSLEEEFDIEIPSEDLQGIVSVGDLVNYIEAHK